MIDAEVIDAEVIRAEVTDAKVIGVNLALKYQYISSRKAKRGKENIKLRIFFYQTPKLILKAKIIGNVRWTVKRIAFYELRVKGLKW